MLEERRSGRLRHRVCRRHGSTRTAEEAARPVQRACPRGQRNVIDQSREAKADVDEIAESSAPVVDNRTQQLLDRSTS